MSELAIRHASPRQSITPDETRPSHRGCKPCLSWAGSLGR
jgi:hypothetical protein